MGRGSGDEGDDAGNAENAMRHRHHRGARDRDRYLERLGRGGPLGPRVDRGLPQPRGPHQGHARP